MFIQSSPFIWTGTDVEQKNKLEQMIDVVTDKIMEAASFLTGSEVIKEEEEVEEEETK